MIIESGVIVALGILGFFIKMSWRARLRSIDARRCTVLREPLTKWLKANNIEWSEF